MKTGLTTRMIPGANEPVTMYDDDIHRLLFNTLTSLSSIYHARLAKRQNVTLNLLS